MTCREFSLEIADLVDSGAELPQAVAEHAANCAACRSLIADLRENRHALGKLALLRPSRDLWPGIEARIDTPVIGLNGLPINDAPPLVHPIGIRARAAGLPWRMAGIAATLLIAGTAIVTTLATRHEAKTAAPAQPTTVASDQPAANDSAYVRQISGLIAVVNQRRPQLDSRTIAAVDRNIQVLDQAIAQCRQALMRDPQSDFLIESLTAEYQRKVEVLQTAATLPAAN